MEKWIDEKTLIGQIVSEYPEAVDILFAVGMHCLGCPASQAESLEEACAVHGIDVQTIVEAINKRISDKRG